MADSDDEQQQQQQQAGPSDTTMVDPETQALYDLYDAEDENRILRMKSRLLEIAKLERENAKLQAEDGDMAQSYIDINKQQIAKLKQMNADDRGTLGEIQERVAAEEARRQAGFSGGPGGKRPFKGLKAPSDRPESEEEEAERLERERKEALSDGDDDDDDEVGEEQYDYGYNAEDDPGSSTYEKYAAAHPSTGGKKPAAPPDDDDDDDGDDDDEDAASFEEDERLLKQRLDTVDEALDRFKSMSDQTIRNAEACHEKAKALVEAVRASQGIPDALLELVNDVLGTSAQTLVDAYSTEEMVERAGDNMEPAVDRLAEGAFSFQRRSELHGARVDNAREAIREIQRENTAA